MNDQLKPVLLPPAADSPSRPLGGTLMDGAMTASGPAEQVDGALAAGREAMPLALAASRYSSCPGPVPVKAPGKSRSTCQLPADGKVNGVTADEHCWTAKGPRSAITVASPVVGSGIPSFTGWSLRA